MREPTPEYPQMSRPSWIHPCTQTHMEVSNEQCESMHTTIAIQASAIYHLRCLVRFQKHVLGVVFLAGLSLGGLFMYVIMQME